MKRLKILSAAKPIERGDGFDNAVPKLLSNAVSVSGAAILDSGFSSAGKNESRRSVLFSSLTFYYKALCIFLHICCS